MPLYYFHFREGSTLERDEMGVDLPDVNAAIIEAKTATREMLSDMIVSGANITSQAFEICDQDGSLVATVSFREILYA